MIMSSQFDAHILIVDDQESNVLLLQSILDDEGYTNLKTTIDPRQIVSLLKEFQPDLILLDLMMPYLDGYTVMEQLRLAIPPDTYLPVLVLTADANPLAKQRALDLGAKDFLTKPFDQVEVLLRIRNLLETRALHLQQQKQNQILEEKICERTAHIQQQLERLAALHTINTAIAGSLDLRLILGTLLDQVISQLDVDAADVLLYNPALHLLKYVAGIGFRTQAFDHTQIRLGESYAGRAALERRMISLDPTGEQADASRFTRALQSESFTSYYAVPLIAKGQIKGVLEIFQRALLQPDSEWLDFLNTLAGQAAIAIDVSTLFENLERSNTELILAYDATIEGWSRALDLRDKETEGHTQRATETTVRLARAFDLGEKELVQVRWGALLHDIGKMAIPDSILFKPSRLTDEEWVMMKKHPVFAYELLSPVHYLRLALDIPYCHHEKWDGTGYPRGLKGEQIPLTARIFAVVDVWDALRSDRPYRSAWPGEKVLAHIRSAAGTHFDPQVVKVFFESGLGA